MIEEEKEVNSTDEELDSATEESSEEEVTKDDFVKDEEVVSTGKYNQAVRKQREAELEKRELEKRLAELEGTKVVAKEEVKEEDDSFFADEPKVASVDAAKMMDEKLKPVMDSLKQREENDKRIARTAFFERNPQYRDSSEKWQELLDEMDNSLNPHSKDDYITQLEKAHRILSGESYDTSIDDKKREMASTASSSGDGAVKGAIKEEFTAEDRKHMATWNISEEGMRAAKAKLASGSMRIL